MCLLRLQALILPCSILCGARYQIQGFMRVLGQHSDILSPVPGFYVFVFVFFNWGASLSFAKFTLGSPHCSCNAFGTHLVIAFFLWPPCALPVDIMFISVVHDVYCLPFCSLTLVPILVYPCCTFKSTFSLPCPVVCFLPAAPLPNF